MEWVADATEHEDMNQRCGSNAFQEKEHGLIEATILLMRNIIGRLRAAFDDDGNDIEKFFSDGAPVG